MLTVILLAAIALARPPAHAEPVQHNAASSPWAAGLPDESIPDAELVVALDNPAAQLRGPAGASLRRFFTEAGAFNRTAGAWTSLSAALGLDPDTAIGRLLGGRVLLLANDPGGDALTWALVLTVDDTTAKLVTRRLKGSPRSAISGHTVYSIEDGLVRLAYLRSQPRGKARNKAEPDHAQPDQADQGSTVLVISPRGDDSALKSGVALGSTWIKQSPAPVAPVAQNGVIVYRPPGGGALTGRIRTLTKGWTVEFEGTGFDQPEGPVPNAAKRVTPAVRFEPIARDSLLAYAGPARGPGDPGSALGALAPERLVWMLIPFDTPDAFLGDNSRTAVLSIADAGGGRLDCSMWFGVGSIIQAARDGDDYVCRVLGELTDQYGPGKDAPECTGQEPTASRSVQVLLDPARSSFGPALSFAWGPACTGNPAACGWWGLRVAAMDGLAGAVRPPALPGVSKKSDATRVRLHARPAGLAGLLGSRAGVGAELLEPLRWLDTLRWELDRPGPAGHVRGTLTVLMNTEQ